MINVTEEETQLRLQEIWEKLLSEEVSPEDDFFALGGDSLLVVDVVTHAREAGLALKAADVFEYPVLQDLARSLAVRGGKNAEAVPTVESAPISTEQAWRSYLSPWSEKAPSCLVPLIEEGTGSPLFVVHPGSGNVRFTASFTGKWAPGRKVYGFEAPGYRAEVRPLLSISDIAERYVTELVAKQPHGPYYLAGLCLGGVVAVEMARRLQQRGEAVALVALINISPMEPFINRGWGLDEILGYRLRAIQEKFGLAPADGIDKFLDAMLEWEWIEDDISSADFYRLHMLWSALAFAQIHYEFRRYDGRVVIFQDYRDASAIRRTWHPLLPHAETHWIRDGVDRLSSIARSPIVSSELGKELGRVQAPNEH